MCTNAGLWGPEAMSNEELGWLQGRAKVTMWIREGAEWAMESFPLVSSCQMGR